MSLAHLLKKGSLRGVATATHATFATHDPFSRLTVATVATVAVASTQKQAANDPALDPFDAATVATVATVAVANAPAPDLDRWAWPHSNAMNTREIDTFTARLHHFTQRGLVELDAEKLADKLVVRDRESDDRRLCLECAHMSRAMRCNNWQRAGLGAAGIPAGMAIQLQRCDGFTHSINT